MTPLPYCQVVIPRPVMELTTRRVMTMEWVTGVKISTLPPDEVGRDRGLGPGGAWGGTGSALSQPHDCLD